jgi:hypothetical protein
MDKRLEEQLERMRQLSARVAQIHEQLAHNTELMTRDRRDRPHEVEGRSPLHEVRDFRTWSQSLEQCDQREGHGRAIEHGARDTHVARSRAHADHRRHRRRHR